MNALLTVYDAVAVGTIPGAGKPWAGQLFLAYIDGDSPTLQAIIDTFPGVPASHIFTVTTGSMPGARICDSELGDDTSESAAAWAHGEIQAGRRPTVYCEIENRPSVKAFLADWGLEFGRDVDCFSAWWNGEAELVQYQPGTNIDLVGEVGHQYLNVSKETYDVSVVLASWAAIPAPPRPIIPVEADFMLFEWNSIIYLVSGYPAKATQLTKNAAVAVKQAVTAGNAHIIQDVEAGLYNLFVVGNAG
jgi:hypothetical protein